MFAVRNAAAAGHGITFLPCYLGEPDPRLVRVGDTIDDLTLDLWVLTHPDLRRTTRVKAVMDHLHDEFRQRVELFGGPHESSAAARPCDGAR